MDVRRRFDVCNESPVLEPFGYGLQERIRYLEDVVSRSRTVRGRPGRGRTSITWVGSFEIARAATPIIVIQRSI